MVTTNLNKSVLSLAAAMIVALALAPAPADAALFTQLGILDLAANGGINPATGAPWAKGDTYRFIFATSTGRDATSTDINDYNTFVQNAANASTLGGAGTLGSVTWKAMASTATVDARDNTDTNEFGGDGTGESFWLLNGTSLVADNYADLYGSNTHSSVINVSETGAVPPDFGDFSSVWTGSNFDGTVASNRGLGDASNLARTGLWNFTSGAHWIHRFDIDNTLLKNIYGVSEVLVLDVPAPAALPAGLAMLGLVAVRRRRMK